MSTGKQAARERRERYNAQLFDVCKTQFTLLKHRVGQLEEMPEAERKDFQDFCDSFLLLLQSFITGEPDTKAMKELCTRTMKKGNTQ